MSDTVLGWLFNGWLFDGSSHHAPRRAKRDPDGDSIDSLDHARANARHTLVSEIGGIPATVLAARIRAGDEGAFRVLYESLFPTLWRIAVFGTHDGEVAGDIIHDVFLSLWTRRDTLNADLDLWGYCVVAVRNQVWKVQQHIKVVTATAEAVVGARLDPPGVGQAPPPANVAVESQEMQAIYQQALADLDARERTAALLRWEERYSFAQIAQVLGTTKVGARHILLRAERKVKRRLAEYRV